MNNVREILRCSHDLKLSNTTTAKAAGCSPHTVAKVLRRAAVVGISWPIDPGIGDGALEDLIYPTKSGRTPGNNMVMPDFSGVAQELKSNHVTRYLVWLEYRELWGERAYSYSWFTVKYAEFINSSALSMHLVHLPGKAAFIDYCGMTVPVHDSKNGEVAFYAQILVVTLAYSGYSYVEAQRSQDSQSFISGIVNSLEFFSGVPESLVPDNLAAAVDRGHSRVDPKINRALREMAEHYGSVVLPARARKPKDKAKVEQMVGYIERRILARIRNQRFYNLAELNEVIWNLADELNATRFQTLDTSRKELFDKNEQIALKPLNANPYEYAIWKTIQAGTNYHVLMEKSYYSLPYIHRNIKVQVRMSSELVQIFLGHTLIATHRKSQKPGEWISNPAHMPDNHLSYQEAPAKEATERAKRIGEATTQIALEILERQYSRSSAVQSAMCLVRLSETYGKAELEQACEVALSIGSPTRASVASILKNGITTVSAAPRVLPPPQHENLRGASYFVGAK